MAEETTKEQIDPQVLEQTRQQIQRLVAEIADLAESDIQPTEFYQEFLSRAVAAVAASGGALWLLDAKGTLKLQHNIEFRQTGLLDGRVRTQPHDALLGCLFQAAQPQIIPPGASVEGMPQAGNPTPFSLIFAPLLVDKQVVGLVEILMDPNRQAAQKKNTLRFVSDLCDLAGQYFKNRQMRQMVSQQRLWNQLEGFTHSVHSSLDLTETAYSVANEGKRLVGCDRLSVALKIGGRTMIEAVSGQEVVEQRSNLIREMTRLCKLVIKSGEDLVYTGHTEGFPPDIRDALEAYVDESGSKAVVVTILHKPDTEPNKDKVAFGCIVAEQIGDEVALTDIHSRAEVVSRHSSTALYNAQEHHRIFLRPVLKALGTPGRYLRGRTLAKIGAVLAAALLAILVMTFVPWELSIQGRGSILPEERRNTYAPLAATVKEVYVDHGDFVKKGQLLALLENKDLEKQLEELKAQYTLNLSEYQNLERQLIKTRDFQERDTLAGRQHEAQIKYESAREQRQIVEEELELLKVTSPHDGVIVTWEAKKNLLGRPVEIGQELISVASTDGDWVLEVNVPDHDMGPIREAEKRLAAWWKPIGEARGSVDAAFSPAEGVAFDPASARSALDDLARAIRTADPVEPHLHADVNSAVQAAGRLQEKLRGQGTDAATVARAKADLDDELDRLSRLEARFVSATDPEHRYRGFVRRIASKAETLEGEHVVKVTVGFSDRVRQEFLRRNQELRPGAEVRARVECGQARLAYCLFRDVIQAFHETVMFRWPFL